MGGARDDSNRQNEAIMVILTITSNVMSSAAEENVGNYSTIPKNSRHLGQP